MSATVTEPVVATAQGRRSWPVSVAIIVSAGLAVGIVTQILQGVLPDGWGVLANSGVMWALMAFALGAAMPTVRWASVGGATQLVIASVVYYVAVDWYEGISSDPRGAIIWSAAGLVAGPVFAVAGHWCARRSDLRHPALALVSGVLLGEGTYLTWFVGNPDLRPAGIVELGIATALAVVCTVGPLRSSPGPSRLLVPAVTIVAATATLAAVRLIDAVFMAS